MSFSLFGFDVQLNDKIVPFILDVNILNDAESDRSQFEINLLKRAILETFKLIKISKD